MRRTAVLAVTLTSNVIVGLWIFSKRRRPLILTSVVKEKSWHKIQGCLDWQPEEELAAPPRTGQLLETNETNHIEPGERIRPSSPPPTGLAITLAKGTGQTMAWTQYELLCNLVPTQQAYFLEPHGIDLLVLIDLEGYYTMDMVISCMNLTSISDTPHTWQNLDGSNLTTYSFRSESGQGLVYLADYVMPYPDYIQQNMTILNDTKVGCTGDWPTDYVQGTRYYSGEVFELGILQGYDYWLKIDTDIRFNATVPFHVLHDMKLRGSLFAHTAEYPNGDWFCATGARQALDDYIRLASSPGPDRPAWAQPTDWKQPCSAGVPRFERAHDEYYTNFIMGSTKFWQSDPVRHFAKYMNEYYPGFFRYRWTDQIFFHLALGLFVGPDFQKYVADYTDLRCAPYSDCWYFWLPNTPYYCANGGYFVHGKSIVPWKGYASLNLTLPSNGLFRGVTPYQSKYVENCDKRQQPLAVRRLSRIIGWGRRLKQTEKAN